MIYWKCPNCKRMRTYDPEQKLIMKVCHTCQIPMDRVEDKTLEVIYNGWGN